MCLLFSRKLTRNDWIRYIGHILPNAINMPLITWYFKNISIKLIKALLVDKTAAAVNFFGLIK